MTAEHYTPRDMLARLVAFDTTSRDGNLPLIEFVEAYLEGWGIKSLRVDYEAGKKTNLYATIGPDIAGGIVLSGHTDVVPVDGQDWSSDPFTLTEQRRQALWPRHLRHEGLPRHRPGAGAAIQGGEAQDADPSGALLR